MQSHHYTPSPTSSLSPSQLGYTCLLMYVLVCGATALANNTFYLGTVAKYVPFITNAGNYRNLYAGNAGSNTNNYAGFGSSNLNAYTVNNNYNKNIDNNRNRNITDKTTYQDKSNKPQTYSPSFASPSVSTTSSLFSTSSLSSSSPS